MVGIPVYAPEPGLHDFIVQADGAFEETIHGILNLATLGQCVEIRIVVQRHTVPILPGLAVFIARNLPFVDQVALMGLEMTGLARPNSAEVWIDPADYQPSSSDATFTLAAASIATKIYNHQLCVLDERLWPFAVRSISDWKNDYLDICGTARSGTTAAAYSAQAATASAGICGPSRQWHSRSAATTPTSATPGLSSALRNRHGVPPASRLMGGLPPPLPRPARLGGLLAGLDLLGDSRRRLTATAGRERPGTGREREVEPGRVPGFGAVAWLAGFSAADPALARLNAAYRPSAALSLPPPARRAAEPGAAR